jgi:hypothetical protein
MPGACTATARRSEERYADVAEAWRPFRTWATVLIRLHGDRSRRVRRDARAARRRPVRQRRPPARHRAAVDEAEIALFELHGLPFTDDDKRRLLGTAHPRQACCSPRCSAGRPSMGRSSAPTCTSWSCTRSTRRRPDAGALDLLARAREADLTLGLASNSPWEFVDRVDGGRDRRPFRRDPQRRRRRAPQTARTSTSRWRPPAG